MAQAALEAAHVSAPGSRSVKSSYRTVEVLELLAESESKLTLAQIQRSLGIPKTSLFNLLRTLVERGWLSTDARGTSYGLGLRALRLGADYLAHDALVQATNPVLARLNRAWNETFHLARLDGAHVVYLASRESSHQLRAGSLVGQRVPAHATALGQALLAHHAEEQVDALLPDHLASLTPHTITDRHALKAKLQTVRAAGRAVEREENSLGLLCLGVAIPQHPEPTDALSCSMPIQRATDDHLDGLAHDLYEAAEELGRIARHLR